MFEPRALRASAALAAYAEPLLEGRRVIVFGDASSALATQLVERGARLVHVYDPEPSRVAEAATRNTSRNISIAPLSETGLAAREGAFELGIVEDLPSTGPAHSVLKRLRRALGPRGVALIAAPNSEARVRLLTRGRVIDGALDYYQLYDAVAAEFEHVRMLGQTPFVGFAVVDFAAEDTPEPSLDAGFVPGGAEEPEWFIALAASYAIRLDEFAVVQLPAASVLEARNGGAIAAEWSREAQRALARTAELEAEARELRARVRALEGKQPDASAVIELRQQLADRDRWIAELEARAAVADARADEAETELEEIQAERQREQHEALGPARALEAQLASARAELASLRTRLSEQDERLRKLTELPPADDDFGGLERQLRQRGEEIRVLERQLQTAERVGRELLGELERLHDSGAEREADLWAAKWTIRALQGSGAGTELEAELAEARAELQRQAVLLAQAAREGGSAGT